MKAAVGLLFTIAVSAAFLPSPGEARASPKKKKSMSSDKKTIQETVKRGYEERYSSVRSIVYKKKWNKDRGGP